MVGFFTVKQDRSSIVVKLVCGTINHVGLLSCYLL